MGVASMDSFLKSLLVEQQADICTNDCIVVVDNARLHPDSWSELPTRLRDNLTLKSDPFHSAKPLTRRKKKQANQCCNIPHALEAPCPTRWGCSNKCNSTTTNKSKKLKQKKQPALTPSAAPAPPSCPQRQKSIEVTPQDWANLKNSPSSVLDSVTEEGPRMPKRQASVALESADSLPPPPMMLTTTTMPVISRSSSPTRSNRDSESSMLFSPDFSKKVKRSSVSLLDDDSDSESEDENTALFRSFRSC